MYTANETTTEDRMLGVIERQHNAVQIARAFAQEYGPKMPKGLPGTLAFSENQPIFMMSLPLYNDDSGENRARLLSAAGELFGRHDWTRHENYSRRWWNWKKTVAGVTIMLHEVESMDTPLEGSPVLPQAFPLLLAEPEPPQYDTPGDRDQQEGEVLF